MLVLCLMNVSRKTSTSKVSRSIWIKIFSKGLVPAESSDKSGSLIHLLSFKSLLVVSRSHMVVLLRVSSLVSSLPLSLTHSFTRSLYFLPPLCLLPSKPTMNWSYKLTKCTVIKLGPLWRGGARGSLDGATVMGGAVSTDHTVLQFSYELFLH